MRRYISALLSAAAALFLVGCAAPAAAPARPTPSLLPSTEGSIEMMAACMQDKGWEISLDESGNSEVDIPIEQYDAYSAARDECMATVQQEFDVAPLNDAQLTEIYNYELWLAQCLRDEGVDVPEAPSEQTFKERYTSSDPWLSYSYIGDMGQSEYESLTAACPQL